MKRYEFNLEVREQKELPIVEVILSSQQKEAEEIIFTYALKAIQIAESLGGIMIQEKSQDLPEATILVNFSTIFPTHNKCEKFILNIDFM